MLKWCAQGSAFLFIPSQGAGRGGSVMATSYTRISCSEFSKPNRKRICSPKALVGVACPFLNKALGLEACPPRSGFTTCPFGGGRRWFSPICYGIDLLTCRIHTGYYTFRKSRKWILGKQNQEILYSSSIVFITLNLSAYCNTSSHTYKFRIISLGIMQIHTTFSQRTLSKFS